MGGWLVRIAAAVMWASAGAALSQAPRPAPLTVVTPKAPRPALAAVKTVTFIYFVPTDHTIQPRYVTGIRAGAARMANWYATQLEGRRLRFNATPLIGCRGEQPAAFYSTQSYTRVLEAVNRCFPQVRMDDPDHMWVIYADARHQCKDPDRMGAGVSSTTIMPIQDLQGLAGESGIINDCGDANTQDGPTEVNRWIGGLSHEFGHAVGLPHPPGCEANAPTCEQNALMWAGYATFPDTYLRPEEKRHLIESGFFDPR